MIEEQSIPVLGICYGMQEMAHVFGGKVGILFNAQVGVEAIAADFKLKFKLWR